MLWLRLRVALLALVALAGMSGFARAGDCCEPSCCEVVKKICVTEWVPQTCEGTRTVYKTEWKEEAYKTYKT